jgi:hypothetical protein
MVASHKDINKLINTELYSGYLQYTKENASYVNWFELKKIYIRNWTGKKTLVIARQSVNSSYTNTMDCDKSLAVPNSNTYTFLSTRITSAYRQ